MDTGTAAGRLSPCRPNFDLKLQDCRTAAESERDINLNGSPSLNFAAPSMLLQGGSASPRTVVFTVGSPPSSSTPPTCSHLGTRPRTTSGEQRR